MIRETHRLQCHAEMPARDAALFQQGFGDTIDRGGRDRNGAESRKTRRCDSEDFAVRINYRAADSRRLQADIEPDVWGKRGASPRAAFRDHKAHDSKCRHGTAGSRPSYNQRNAARLNGSGIAPLDETLACVRAFQDSKIARRIAACESRRHKTAIGQRYLNFVVAPK